MKSLWSRVLLAVGIVALLAGPALLVLPDVRQQLFGYELAHHLQTNQTRELSMASTLTRGREILGEETPAAEPSVQESIQLSLIMEEKVVSSGREEALTYSVREMRSEQLNANVTGVLSKEQFTLRIPHRGGLTAISRPDSAQRDVLGDSTLAQLFVPVWLPLPEGWVRPIKTRWQGTYDIVAEPMPGEKLRLKHRVEVALISVEERSGRQVGVLEFAGSAIPERLEGKAEPSGGVQCMGKAMIDFQTGLAVMGRCVLVQDLRLKDPDTKVTMRLYEQQDTSFWRPGMSEEPKPEG